MTQYCVYFASKTFVWLDNEVGASVLIKSLRQKLQILSDFIWPPPEKTLVISMDEKPSIEALERATGYT